MDYPLLQTATVTPARIAAEPPEFGVKEQEQAMAGKRYEGSDGKPTHLELDEVDRARIRAAGRRGPLLDEISLSAWAYPAGTWAAWFEALGLHDLAERARTELAEFTNAGAQMTEMLRTSGRLNPPS